MRGIDNKEAFKELVTKDVLRMLDELENLGSLDSEGITEFNTAIVNVDIINGFCKLGPLS